MFNRILCTRSYPQLRATFSEYRRIAEEEGEESPDIEDAIKSEVSGDLQEGFLSLGIDKTAFVYIK